MTERYDMVFQIKEEISEEYLGEFSVTDKETNISHTFFVRGDDHEDNNHRTFDPQFIEEGTLGDTVIWIEAFPPDFKLSKNAVEMEDRIEEEKVGINLDEFVTDDKDCEAITKSIISHYQTGESVPYQLKNLNINHIETILINRAAGELLIEAAANILDSGKMMNFANTVNGTYPGSISQNVKILTSEIMVKEAAKHNISLEDSRDMLMMLDRFEMKRMGVNYLNTLPTEERNILRYGAYVMESNESYYDAGEVYLMDRLSQESVSYTIWTDDNSYDDETASSNAIFSNQMFIKVIPEDFNDKEYKTFTDLANGLDDELQEEYDIDSFFESEAPIVKKAILQNLKTDEGYNLSITDSTFLSEKVGQFLADNTILDTSMRAKAGILERQDVTRLARVLDNPKVKVLGKHEGLESAIVNVYKTNSISQSENKLFKELFKKMNFKQAPLTKFKQNEMSIER